MSYQTTSLERGLKKMKVPHMLGVLLLLLLFLTLAKNAYASGVPVSVLKFENKVGASSCNQDWYWWQDHLGTAFQDMLITELQKNSKFEVYERENINQMYANEHQLVNSQAEEKIETGKFKKAKYTFVGAVSGYEYCAQKTGGSVNVGMLASLVGFGGVPSVNIGLSKANAKVIIDLRVIDTRTGRIVKSIKAEGEASRKNFKVAAEIGDFGDAMETPVGEASRSAIEKATKEILAVL